MLKSENLLKRYNGKPAVDGLTAELQKGQIYGVLGPNGSGKSTWMKMMGGLIVPESGSITLDGEPAGVETKKDIAYMSTEPFYYSYMKIQDVGKYYQDFFDDFDMDCYEALINRLGLDGKMKVRNLSSGMAAKLKIAATMSRKAKVYLLDEPFNGIDLLARDEIVDMILESVSEDSILLISSHMVEELEKIVDSVLFLREGQLVLQGNVDDIREQRGKSIADLYREIFRQ